MNSSRPPRSLAQQAILLRRVAALMIFVGITAGVMLFRNSLPDLREWGYGGAFLASLISSATIVLPLPGLAVTFALGGSLSSPLLVGLAAGLGETLGELTGYLAGYSGRAIVEDRDRYELMVERMERYGPGVIFLLAALPTPVFDLAGVAAGTLGMGVGKFLLACWPGKTLKTTLVAFAGAGMLPWLTQWITRIVH